MIRKAPPKHAEKVACGSVTPSSVPATCARGDEKAPWRCTLTRSGTWPALSSGGSPAATPCGTTCAPNTPESAHKSPQLTTRGRL
eukprot:1196366-Prorocentrum_minimum.AAC.6